MMSSPSFAEFWYEDFTDGNLSDSGGTLTVSGASTFTVTGANTVVFDATTNIILKNNLRGSGFMS